MPATRSSSGVIRVCSDAGSQSAYGRNVENGDSIWRENAEGASCRRAPYTESGLEPECFRLQRALFCPRNAKACGYVSRNRHLFLKGRASADVLLMAVGDGANQVDAIAGAHADGAGDGIPIAAYGLGENEVIVTNGIDGQ